jgi:hypothetical protein
VTTSSRGRHAVDQVAQAADSDWLTRVARVGLAGFGVVHLLLAWLALQIAWATWSTACRPREDVVTLVR